jgi:pantoate--beta-alanine ligase
VQIVRSVDEMLVFSRAWRAGGERVGFVPTMGYLHRGHTSLMRQTRPHCDTLVVSIYVNPLQFGPHEDYARYPRDPDGDADACRGAGVDVLFMPDTLYPPGFASRVRVDGITDRWEGAVRPGHFEGVATVVARLFGLVQPTVATFGEKDFQQLAVIRALTRDLALPIEILTGALVRDADGLALSSRNVYLSPADRLRARSLHRACFAVRDHASPHAEERLAAGRALLECDALDYLALVDADTLEPLTRVDGPAQVIAAARYGPVRLLDTVSVPAP